MSPPEAIKRYLGYTSIAVMMDIYGHLFPSDAEDLVDKLDALWRQTQASTPVTARRRTKRALMAVDGES